MLLLEGFLLLLEMLEVLKLQRNCLIMQYPFIINVSPCVENLIHEVNSSQLSGGGILLHCKYGEEKEKRSTGPNFITHLGDIRKF